MASNAERQAAYRRRHSEVGGARINMAVSAHAAKALQRLALHYGVTHREMLERLLADTEGNLVQPMSAADQKRYYELRRNDD